MKIYLKEIKKDVNKRFMFCQGFQHGNLGIPKQLPSYEKQSYELGYKMGREGKLEEYIGMTEEDSKNVKTKKSFTRTKSK